MPGTAPLQHPSALSRNASTAALLAVVASAAFVFSGSLAYFFSTDDFATLARVRGLAPPFPGLWRWLSGPVYFGLMKPLGLRAAAYHAVNLCGHAACAGILFALLSRRFSAPAALLGALFFAVHPALYTAVYWISTVNEILALLFALLSIACAALAGPLAWASVPLFALSLLAKETTLLLPLALWVSPGWLDAPTLAAAPAGFARRRARVRVALSAVALAYLVLWIGTDAFGTRSHPETTAPYAVGVGRHVALNALSYLGWTAGTILPVTRHFEDVAEPGVWPWAVAALALWLAGSFSSRLRASGWLAGGATYAVLLLPVLVLRNHTYHHYLYAPLIGAAWCVAALADALLGAAAPRPAHAARRSAPAALARPRAAWAWPAAFGAGLLLVLNGALLVRKIESVPFADDRLRADPTVDRALIARRVYDGIAASAPRAGERLVFWSPSSMQYEHQLHPDADVIHRETYWERNVRAAIQDGLGVRVMFPQVDSVEFLHAYQPAGPETRFVLYDIDGTVQVETPAYVDSVLRAAAAPR